jgi:site-specific DNA recombinase
MVLTYSRTSTSRQGHSVDNQISKLRDYVRQNNYTDAVELVDEAVSGKTANRKGYQQMIEMIKSKKVDIVITYSLSRFSRNTKDTLSAVELMNKYNVKFISLKEDVNTDSPLGKYFLTNMSALYSLERDMISERVKDILQHRRKLGFRVGAIPFGKKLLGNKLVNERSEQYTIQLVKELRNKNMSYSKIIEQLIIKRRKNKLGRVKWSDTQIRRILNKI